VRITKKAGRVLAPLLVVLSIGAATAPSQASAADAWCSAANASANHGFNAYVPVEGLGLVGWRSYMGLQARDRCDHGALSGIVGVYDANLRHNGRGNVGMQVSYSLNGGGWTGRNLRVLNAYRTGGWQYFNVLTNGHIDMSRGTRLTHVKVTTYPIAGGVPQGLSARSSICNTVSGQCTTRRGF
jgi:hypothetical protein